MIERKLSIRERFPPPWIAREVGGGFCIEASNGVAIAYVYAVDPFLKQVNPKKLSWAEAHAIATSIAQLADKQEPA